MSSKGGGEKRKRGGYRIARETTDLGQLLLKHINLIQEQHNARPQEPPRVDHALEQHEALHHPILVAFLEEDLVVFGEGGAEDDGGY